MPIATGVLLVTKRPLQLRDNIVALDYFSAKYHQTQNKQEGSMQTNEQYDEAVQSAKDIFLKKTRDYGTSWRVLRTISVVDQIFIKALRVKTIQEKGAQKVDDSIRDEFIGILNY